MQGESQTLIPSAGRVWPETHHQHCPVVSGARDRTRIRATRLDGDHSSIGIRRSVGEVRYQLQGIGPYGSKEMDVLPGAAFIAGLGRNAQVRDVTDARQCFASKAISSDGTKVLVGSDLGSREAFAKNRQIVFL